MHFHSQAPVKGARTSAVVAVAETKQIRTEMQGTGTE